MSGSGRLLAGRYRLQESIGLGPGSELWRGMDERSGEAVAVELSGPDGADEAASAWDAELEASRGFRHPLVAPTLATGRDAGSAYVVRAHVEGRSLEDLLEEGPIDAAAAERIAVELCRLLAKARKAGAAHRAVVPRQVVIDTTGAPHLLGLLSGREGPISLDSQRFIAPEQRTATTRSEPEDVYNVGALLHETCTTTVTIGDDSGDCGTAGQGEALRGLMAVAHKAVEREAADRYATLAEMLDALRARREAHTIGRHLQAVVGLAAAAVALGVLAGSFAGTRVVVPSVVGMSQAQASARLRRIGLAPAPDTPDSPGETHVARQVPAAGARVTRRTVVLMRLHRGPH